MANQARSIEEVFPLPKSGVFTRAELLERLEPPKPAKSLATSTQREPVRPQLLVGEHVAVIDGKFRVAIPRQFRQPLIDGFYTLLSPERSLWLIPSKLYEQLIYSMGSEQSTHRSPRKNPTDKIIAMQHLTATTEPCTKLDVAHRFSIPRAHRSRETGFYLGAQVRICGSGNFLEIWTAKAWRCFQK